MWFWCRYWLDWWDRSRSVVEPGSRIHAIPRRIIEIVNSPDGNVVFDKSVFPIDVLVEVDDVNHAVQVHLIDVREVLLDGFHLIVPVGVVVPDVPGANLVLLGSVLKRNFLEGKNVHNTFHVILMEVMVVVIQNVRDFVHCIDFPFADVSRGRT